MTDSVYPVPGEWAAKAQVDANRLAAEVLLRHGSRQAEPATDLEKAARALLARRVFPQFAEEASFVVGVVHLPDDAVEIVLQPLRGKRSHDELLSAHRLAIRRMM